MENFLPKMTQVGEDGKKQTFVNTNVRQFEAQSLSVPKQAKPEGSNAQEQAFPMALRSMQEKMDQNAKETSTKVSYILKKIERVDKELAAAKSDGMTSEMLQIGVIDDMRDAISELKNNISDVIGDLRMNKDHTFDLAYELWVVKDDLRKVTKNLKDFQEKEELEHATLEDDIMEVREETSEVRDQISVQVKEETSVQETDTVKELERRGDELVDVETALKSLKDALKKVTNELESVKDVAAKLGKDVMCELNDVEEELRVVKENTRAANGAARNETAGVQEGNVLHKLQEVTDEVSCVKRDLRDICVEVTDELEMGVGGRLQDIRRDLKSIRHEMRAAKDERKELRDADLEFHDTVRNAQTDPRAQNVEPTSGDQLRDTTFNNKGVMTNLISNKKRKEDSRHPTFKQNCKRLRKQSSRGGDQRATVSAPCASGLRMSAASSSSDSDSSR